MELLRKAVDSDWSKPAGYDMKNMTRAVSEEEWKSLNAKFYDLSDGYMLIETSKEDMQKIEDFLQIKCGFFGTIVMIKTTLRCCRNCVRENNFLDVLSTGLRVHQLEFLADVLPDTHGPILNTHQTQRCFCFACAEEWPEQAAKYSFSAVNQDDSGALGYIWVLRW